MEDFFDLEKLGDRKIDESLEEKLFNLSYSSRLSNYITHESGGLGIVDEGIAFARKEAERAVRNKLKRDIHSILYSGPNEVAKRDLMAIRDMDLTIRKYQQPGVASAAYNSTEVDRDMLNEILCIAPRTESQFSPMRYSFPLVNPKKVFIIGTSDV